MKLFYSPVDPKTIKREKERAKALRGTSWWKQIVSAGLCHYCGKKFDPAQLTMDHILPLGRGGRSTKGNIVVSCKECNSKKAHLTPAELALESLRSEST